MAAAVISGVTVSQEIRDSIRQEVAELKARTGKVPGLAVVLVGEDPASQVYVRNKSEGCAETGMMSFEYRLPQETAQADLEELVQTLNADERVHGILVQLPLPKHLDEKRIISLIDYRKDVDGFHPVNVGKLVVGDDDGFCPCTPYGCKILINKVIPDPRGMHLVVVGRSNIVGKPMASLMVQKKKGADCIVTVCHSAAADLRKYTLSADILVAAIGSPEFIKADMVKEGAVVIDVGVNRIAHPTEPGKTKLVGDVAFNEVSQKASASTPVPGGVGKMTIAMLLSNTLKSFRIHNSL